MLSEDKFINEIWDRYNYYEYNQNKDPFFEKHLYKNNDFLLKLKMIIMSIVFLVTSAGIVYAGAIFYNYTQTSTNTNFQENVDYDNYNQDMTYQNGLYYKKITNYNDYLKAKQRWNNLVELSEEDFNNNFMVIVAGENYSTIGLNIYDISADGNTTYIKLKKIDDNVNNTVVSSKIARELYRDNISIEVTQEEPKVVKYKNLKEISQNYSKEEAIKDNCFVIDNNAVISNDRDMLGTFVKNSEDNINSMIRVAIYFNSNLKIIDLEYKDGEYITHEDNTRGDTGKTYTHVGNKIKVSKNSLFGNEYVLLDKVGNKYIICTYK